MNVVKFELSRDLSDLEAFLEEQYFENHNTVSWLPSRLHDLVYRVSAQDADEGREKSFDHIYLWKENADIVACILPDGENIYLSLKTGYEKLFPSMIDFSEQNCRSLFSYAEDGTVKFWVAVSNSLTYTKDILVQMGYCKYPEEEYMSCTFPMESDKMPELPAGFRLLYGEEYPDEVNKWSALRLGFHPEYEPHDYKASMNPYNARKNSSLYRDCFECIIIDEKAGEGNDVCSYAFVYVDRRTETALIEPVSTREKYRRKGLGRALMYGAVRRCREKGIKKCYVDSFGSRKDFYNAAGFFTEDSISFWYKVLR